MEKKRKSYNSFIVFEKPVTIGEIDGEEIKVYGLLYDRYEKETKRNDLFIYNLNSFVAYLCAAEIVYRQGLQMFPDKIITSTGKIIKTDSPAVKNYIYKVLEDRMVGYRIVECSTNILYKDDEVEDSFIIDRVLLSRYGLNPEIQQKKPFQI